jgi:GNAT superfamily N-acetyltransferase
VRVDVGAVRTILAEAFDADPMMRWLLPADDTRVDASAAWFGIFVERYAAMDRADVIDADGAAAAVALWRMPDDASPKSPSRPTIGGLMLALIGRERAETVGVSLGGALHAITPEEPHAYLNFLAVCPARQRQGLGRRVVERLFATADAAGLGVHLETTNPANHAFYRSIGFEHTAEVTVASGALHMWAMWRAPR